MRIDKIDGGIHSDEDLNKKFSLSYVKAIVANDPNPVLAYIRAIGHQETADGGTRRVVYYDECKKESVQKKVCAVASFDLIQEKPLPGIVNGRARPYKVSYYPEKQWKRGWVRENVSIRNLRDVRYTLGDLTLEDKIRIFFPQYPTLEEALLILERKEKKHIAINNLVSVMKGKDRYIFFKNFVPFLIKKGNMMFKVQETENFLARDYEKYRSLLSQGKE